MPLELLLAFIGFALASSITPGPNNLMLMASGVNYGFSRSIPHLAGITAGFFFMLVMVGFGIGQALKTYPQAYLALKIASVIYLLWLAWRIANSGAVRSNADKLSENGGGSRPINFVEAVLFQWVNPKAWAMAITAAAAYTVPTNYSASLVLISFVFVVVGFPCMVLWTIFGVSMRSFLQNPAKIRIFNITMAVLLVLSFLPVVLDLI